MKESNKIENENNNNEFQQTNNFNSKNGEIIFIDESDINYERNNEISPKNNFQDFNYNNFSINANYNLNNQRNFYNNNLHDKKEIFSEKILNIKNFQNEKNFSDKNINFISNYNNNNISPFYFTDYKNNFFNSQNNSNNFRNFYSNPRDINDHSPLKKNLFPNQNVNDDDDSYIKINENSDKNYLKTKMEKKLNNNNNENDGLIENKIFNNFNVKINEKFEFNENKIKKLINQISDKFNPLKNNGSLISKNQKTFFSSTNEFNERYKLLQKTNKLSTILLTNKKRRNSPQNKNFDFNNNNKNSFNKKTLNETIITKDKKITNSMKSPSNKFLYLSLAMLASKSQKSEDRIILRRMRFEKGGVVDLAQENNNNNNNKFYIKKIIKTNGKFNNINPKHREKAAKIIQNWWRDLKEKYEKILEKIILIQKIWRGKWIRKYIYDIIYINFIYQRFLNIIKNVLIKFIRPKIWNFLFKNKKNFLNDLILKIDNNSKIKNCLKKWKNIINFNFFNEKGKKLIDFREKDELKKNELKKYFKEWVLKSLLLKHIENSNNDYYKLKNQFLGIFDITNGINNLIKRKKLLFSIPKLKYFLNEKAKLKSLKNLMKIYKKFNNFILYKFFSLWNKNVNKIILKNFNKKMSSKNLNLIYSSLNKLKLIRFFIKWKELNKNYLLSKQIENENNFKLLNFFKGINFLQKFIYKITFNYPLNAISNKFYDSYKNKKINKIYKNKNNFSNFSLRKYFNIWRINNEKLKKNEKIYKLFKFLLLSLSNKIKKRILYNKFIQWKKQKKINLNEILKNYGNIMKFLYNYCKKYTKPNKKIFLNNLKYVKSSRKLNNVSKNIFSKYKIKNRYKLLIHLYKWKNQIKNIQLNSMKNKILKYFIIKNDNKNKKIILKKFLFKWFNNENSIKNINYLLKKFINNLILIDINKKLFFLNKWKNIIEKIKFSENADYIQFWIKQRLNLYLKIKNNKFSKFIMKYIKYKILLLGKIYKLNFLIKKIKFNEFLNNLKKFNKKKNIKNLLSKFFSSKFDKNKNKILKNYFNQWKNIIQNMNKKNKINSILFKSINKKTNKNKLKLISVFNKWRGKINLIKSNEYAKIIKNFLKEVEYKNIKIKEKKLRKEKLIYLLKLMNLYKNVLKYNLIREFIRKWRYITFKHKLLQKKKKKILQNLQNSYLIMAENIFGDKNNKNPSILKEFERFGSNIGMFNSENTENLNKINKKYFKNVTKKYLFNRVIYEENDENKNNDSNFSLNFKENEENKDLKIDDFKEISTNGYVLNESNDDFLKKYKKH